jgi:hypothetical protein
VFNSKCDRLLFVQDFICDRLDEQKAALESKTAALKTECEEIMSDIRSSRYEHAWSLTVSPVCLCLCVLQLETKRQKRKCTLPQQTLTSKEQNHTHSVKYRHNHIVKEMLPCVRLLVCENKVQW